jgi:hypothetical protein
MSTQSPAAQPEATPYAFTDRELERLAVYRAAVAACFYTDHCEPTTTRRARQLDRAPKPAAGGRSRA